MKTKNKNPDSPIGSGPRGSGIVQGRYPQDALGGRNVNRRQLDIRNSGPIDSQNNTQGRMQLRPGLWRLVLTWAYEGFGICGFFRLNNPTNWINAIPIADSENGPTEPLPPSVASSVREVFVDHQCELFWCIPPNSQLTAILLSELDEP